MASDGRPILGPSARTLGVRPGIDCVVDTDGLVQPEAGGLSVSPGDPHTLPQHRRPASFGGTGADPVWSIRIDDLVHPLVYRADPTAPLTHGFIEPAVPMFLLAYQQALGATCDHWQHVLPDMLRERAEVDYMSTQVQLTAQFDAALHTVQPVLSLRDLVRNLLVEGWQRDDLLQELGQFRTVLQQHGRDEAEDVVLDVMDFLVGWASPHMKV